MAYKDPEDQKHWRRVNKDKWASYHETWRTKNPQKHKDNYGKQDPLKKMFWSARSRAKKNGVPFNIEFDDLIVPRYCPILGIELLQKGAPHEHKPSIDRVENTLGYVKGNVQIISLRANRLKQDATVEELEKIIAYIRKNTPETQKEHRLVAQATRDVVLKAFPGLSAAIGYNPEGDH